MAFVLESLLLRCWTMCEWNMPVSNVVEEVYFLLLQQETGGNGMHRRIAPPLVEEAAILIQDFEEINVGFRSQPVEVPNLKVGPLYTHISREDRLLSITKLTKWQWL